MNQEILLGIFQVVIVLFSLTLHEIAHGTIALKFGDRTAKDAGRLSFNPLKHLDFFGSFLVPVTLALLRGPVFGWAKPTPVSPYLSKKAHALVAFAGPASNLAVAIVFSILFRIGAATGVFGSLNFAFLLIAYINIGLSVFNMIPIPPLDGSKVLFAVLPPGTGQFQEFLNRFGFLILLTLIFSRIDFLGPLINGLAYLMLGV